MSEPAGGSVQHLLIPRLSSLGGQHQLMTELILMSGNNAQLTSLNLSISRGWDTQGDSSPGSPGSPSSPTHSARAWSQEPGPDLTSKTYMRLRDQDISFASKGNDKEDKETTVSSNSSKYLESIKKLTRIFEKSKLSWAEERKLP